MIEVTWLAVAGDLDGLARVLTEARVAGARGPLGAVLDVLAEIKQIPSGQLLNKYYDLSYVRRARSAVK